MCATTALTDGVNVLIDNIFLGHISTEALTAAGLANNWMFIGFAPIYAIPMYGITVLAGQAAGAGKKKTASVWMARGLILMMSSFPVAVACAFGTTLYCQAYGANAKVTGMAQDFAWVRMFGFFGFGLLLATRSYMQTVEQDMIPPVVAALVSVILNAPLNYLFISLFGFLGSPIATAASQWTAVLGFLVYVRWSRPKVWAEMFSGFDSGIVFRASGLWKMAEGSLPGIFEWLMGMGVMAGLLVAIYRTFEDPKNSITALTIMGGIMAIQESAMLAIGSTLSTRASNAISHSEDFHTTKEWCQRTLRSALFWMGLIMGLTGLIVAADAYWFASWFTNDVAVIDIAGKAFPPFALGFLIMGLDQVFLQMCAGVGYFNTVSAKGGLDCCVFLGAMFGFLYIKRSLDYVFWAMAAAMGTTFPLSVLIYCCIDWEESTKASREKAKEQELAEAEAAAEAEAEAEADPEIKVDGDEDVVD